MPRQPVAPTELTRVFRANLNAYMQARPELSSQNALAKACKVGQTSIGRILNGQQSPTLDMVHKIASVFNVPAWRMLQPQLVVLDASDRARQLPAYEQLLHAAEELGHYLANQPKPKSKP
jgi:transcriptional regulator with XRE-family HTH domain